MDDGKLGSCVDEGGEVGKIRTLGEMWFFGAVLQLRGIDPVMRPFVDVSGNILIFSGEIFGGIHVGYEPMTTMMLQSFCSLWETVVVADPMGMRAAVVDHQFQNFFHQLRGHGLQYIGRYPLRLDATQTLWFGRDAFGRRSLLVHWPTSEDCRLVLYSVSPSASPSREPGTEVEGRESNLAYWEELPCGVYSIALEASRAGKFLAAKLSKHEWMSSMLKDLINWQRNLIEPKLVASSNATSNTGTLQSSVVSPADRVLVTLKKSVIRRTSQNAFFQATIPDDGQKNLVPIAVLFSGGLDSMILAALLHEFIDSRYGIDLLNVSFEGEAAPDRITARAGVKELKNIAPFRRWKLVEIDADLSQMTMEMKHVTSLINPAKTYMDLNIGLALWLAAGGDGWVHEDDNCTQHGSCQRVRYKSEARILLVGSGADEQCAGYGRHRTKFRNSSWLGLHEEMKLDMQRIWKRNLGRDDRCIADNGKEARFPFLDEDVIRILLDFPLWEIANLNQPSGTGDKKILREVARLLGLHEAAVQPKRAIQFGSRIAQESNRKNFGSNRAANQASAGSVEFYKSLS